ncbi:MAG: KpsF/GutQ family sugar-phosphate isomerase [Verrucomicrobia bacterium]|nr:KpsF/GutQ family sugar-phosphate isomerase [Verrucomicrobiota bacterium]
MTTSKPSGADVGRSVSVIEEARRVFDLEIEALRKVRDDLGSGFERFVETVRGCRGKVIVTGMGKSGHVGRKIAATMASLGTPAFFLHPAEAMHGDMGMVASTDLVIAISNSGEGEEIARILPGLRTLGATVVAVTSSPSSTLARASDFAFVFPPLREACALELAPTSSTTAALVLGDALAVVLSRVSGFRKADFAAFHPAGALGRRLLTLVRDLMVEGGLNAVVDVDASLRAAVAEMSEKAINIVNVVEPDGRLAGVLTDGDLRRLLDAEVDLYGVRVREVMTTSPVTTRADALAEEAMRLMAEGSRSITAMPVVESGRLLGTIRLSDILRAGIR